ncbi:MAG: hypothetical protein AAGF30_16560 [Pseudomonadota bacterium]
MNTGLLRDGVLSALAFRAAPSFYGLVVGHGAAAGGAALAQRRCIA